MPLSGQQAFLLENVPCNNDNCRSVGRMFHIHWDQSDLGAIQNAVMATFFDFYEDVSSLYIPHTLSPLSSFFLFYFSMLNLSLLNIQQLCLSAQGFLLSLQVIRCHLQSNKYQIVRCATAMTSLCEIFYRFNKHEAKWRRKRNKSHRARKNIWFL